jgi:hypothetical protein
VTESFEYFGEIKASGRQGTRWALLVKNDGKNLMQGHELNWTKIDFGNAKRLI